MLSSCSCYRIIGVREYKKLFESSISFKQDRTLNYECPLCKEEIRQSSFLLSLFGEGNANLRQTLFEEVTPIFVKCFNFISNCDKCNFIYPVTKPMSCDCSPKFCFQCLRNEFFSISSYCSSCSICKNKKYSFHFYTFFIALRGKNLSVLGFKKFEQEIINGIIQIEELDPSYFKRIEKVESPYSRQIEKFNSNSFNEDFINNQQKETRSLKGCVCDSSYSEKGLPISLNCGHKICNDCCTNNPFSRFFI